MDKGLMDAVRLLSHDGGWLGGQASMDSNMARSMVTQTASEVLLNACEHLLNPLAVVGCSLGKSSVEWLEDQVAESAGKY